jgi:hypothetical protein
LYCIFRLSGVHKTIVHKETSGAIIWIQIVLLSNFVEMLTIDSCASEKVLLEQAVDEVMTGCDILDTVICVQTALFCAVGNDWETDLQ